MDEFRSINPDVPTIILTAHGSIENAVEAMRRGAYTYVTKPFEPADLLLQIERALENRKLNSEIKRLKEILYERYDFADIIARSGKMRAILDVMAARIAKLDSTVHIHGDSGTGKELIAKAIHIASDRKDKPFVGFELRRAAGVASRKRVIRPRKGGIYRRRQKHAGVVHSSPRRHAVFGRDRRYAARHTIEATARFARAAVLSRWQRERCRWRSTCA